MLTTGAGDMEEDVGECGRRRHLVVAEGREHLGELLQAEVVARCHHGPRRCGVNGRRRARRLTVWGLRGGRGYC